MKFATAALSVAALGLALAAGAHADTRSSNDKATMEKRNDASSPKLDEERSESSQGQPNTIGGATVRGTCSANVTAMAATMWRGLVMGFPLEGAMSNLGAWSSSPHCSGAL